MNTPNKYDLPAEAQQLLNVERQALEPPSGAQARVRARVALTVGALAAGATAAGTAKAASAGATASATASATAAGAGTSTAAAAAGAGGGLLFKVLAPVGIGAVLLGGVAAPSVKQRLGWGGGNQTVGAPAKQTESPIAAATPAAEVQPAVVEPQAAQPVVEPSSPGPSAVVRSAPVVRRAAAPALHEERVGLDEARAALADGRTAQALKMLEQHARSHPKGQLAEERDALHVMALVKAGRRPAARAAAAQFHARHPNSVMSGAVDAALSSAQ